jgi:hypothetical protein
LVIQEVKMATMEFMSKERLDRYILEAAKAAAYEQGFGVAGCDLNLRHWWAGYARQSSREQAENDRLAEYLLTCAKLAKQADVIIPREYVIYDVHTSEDLDRPGIGWLRTELMPRRRVSGIIIPTLGRLSMDDYHRQAFEKECQYYGIRFIYGDAPSGTDIGSMFARSGISLGNYLRVKTNRESALAGNISRILAGKVPSQRAAYGYVYRADKIFEAGTGKAKVLRAWWEIDELGPDGEPIYGTPAWAVTEIFIWIGDEARTAYWVANKLNELGIRAPYRTSWAPTTVIDIVHRRCYTGEAEYNANSRVPNPDKPLGDLTLGVKRTLLRPKPDNEKLIFEVPALTTKERRLMANSNLRERGRGRGKQGKMIQALFRSRMLCPQCGKPMSVLRKRGTDQVYYYCRAHYRPWLQNACTFNRFVPGTWDYEIWDEICTIMGTDAWLEQQLSTELSHSADLEKLVRIEQLKISQVKLRVSKVQEGWEKGFYTPEEAQAKLAEHRQAIARAEAEIARLQKQIVSRGLSPLEAELLRQELKALRDRNLIASPYEEKADLVAKLGIKVLPSEDLKSRKILCRLNLTKVNDEKEQSGFAKVMLGRPYRVRTCDTLIKSQVLYQLS